MANNRPPGKKEPTPPLSMGCSFRTLTLWMLIALGVFTLYSLFFEGGNRAELTYTEFLQKVQGGVVASVEIEPSGSVKGEFVSPQQVEGTAYEEFTSYIPFQHEGALEVLQEYDVSITALPQSMDFFQILLSVGPFLLLIGFWIYIMRNSAGGSRALSFGKSKAKLFQSDRPKVTFDDVAGVEEAKEELAEVIGFLKNPGRFQRLGGKVPKGVLLLGPPGTGKTLLARAVAGEAGVPFFSMSGSDFVEMFVGVGASRVRDLFVQGKAKAPCIIFIDEIDAVGRHRGAGLGGGHDEREQTLNALLVEMDGFEPNESVIVMAATNRPDVLDPALLRPGRFDRRIMVSMPDVKGREEILKVHTRKMPIDDGVSFERIARGTPGFSGADLENLANEAALRAARRGAQKIKQEDFDFAVDRIVMGIERRSMVISPEEKKLTAIHESGHAIVNIFTPHTDPLHKVTIVPHGRALGVTSFLPIDDRHNYTYNYCIGVLARMMGGRASEKLFLDSLSTGAGQDLEQATGLARKMVCEWGMSEELGPVTLGEKSEPIFLGRDMSRVRNYSERTARLIDQEITHFVEEAYNKARKILEENRDIVERMSDMLLEQETLTGDEIREILEELRPGQELPGAPPAPHEEESADEGYEGDDGEERTEDQVGGPDGPREDKEGREADTGGSG
ncbi:MAG: ATP-dependent zinc metalloprotease FtsH [Candidatus Fermentibacteraceae bacterium]